MPATLEQTLGSVFGPRLLLQAYSKDEARHMPYRIGLPKAKRPGGFPASPFIEYADLIADQSGFVKRKLVRRLSIGSAALRRSGQTAPPVRWLGTRL